MWEERGVRQGIWEKEEKDPEGRKETLIERKKHWRDKKEEKKERDFKKKKRDL